MSKAPVRITRPTGDQRVDGLLYSIAWDAPISYGFPGSVSDYGSGYATEDGSVRSFSPLGRDQRMAVHTALDETRHDPRQLVGAAGHSVEGFTGLEIAFVGGQAVPSVRPGNSGSVNGAYAYLPYDGGLAGDIWFGSLGRAPRTGNDDFLTVLHEVGHALGLMHPHETDNPYGAVPVRWDTPEYTVMSYRPYQGGPTRGGLYSESAAPQTFMMLDIAALQALYGADFGSNAGDTLYSWDVALGRSLIDGRLALAPVEAVIFQTIWDGGGRDTYDLANFAGPLRIDLAPGAPSIFAPDALAYLGGGPNGGFARGNVFNALQFDGDPRSLIENAVGGAGHDVILGNAAANRLIGNGGNDRMVGRGGDDVLVGGPGRNVLIGGAGNDVYVIRRASDQIVERLAGAAGGIDKVIASTSFGLGDNLETLALRGRAEVAGGNSLGNTLVGTGGANALNGQSGHDVLIGRGGADVLYGGGGKDVFRFLSVHESTAERFDTLRPTGGAAAFQGAGAAPGDRIDLRGIDADAGAPGDQAFRFGEDRTAGSLWAQEWRGNTYIRGNVNDDPAYEFQLRIEDGALGATAYTAEDFLL